MRIELMLNLTIEDFGSRNMRRALPGPDGALVALGAPGDGGIALAGREVTDLISQLSLLGGRPPRTPNRKSATNVKKQLI